MPKPKLPPHTFRVKNRLGKTYTYYQVGRGTARASQRIPLPEFPSPEFWAAYSRLANLPPPRSDTVSNLIAHWQASPDWAATSRATQSDRRRYCRIVEDTWGDLPVSGIKPMHVIALRDSFADRAASANNLLRTLSSMLSWSVPRGWRDDNPAREIKLLKSGHGYEPWPLEIIDQVRATLRPDLWVVAALALYTGQRQADVLAMRWDAITGAGGLAVRQKKTGKVLLIPLHRELRALLDTLPRTAVTIATTTQGRPWSTSGFRAVWQDHRPHILKDRGLVFHGLRKSAVVMLLEAGCTTAEVAAITGQSMQMVEHYAKGINQQRLAQSAMRRWEGA